MSATRKPCPFCGGKLWIGKVESPSADGWETCGYRPSCRDCKAQLEYHPTEDEAIAAWNRRADGWKPIESAPKEQEILVWSPLHGGKVLLARWDANKFAKTPKPYWSFNDERIWGTSQVRMKQPTHWMPLPSAPEVL